MTLFQNIRTKKAFKIVAAYLALNLLAEIAAPTFAMALTNGPSQPEVQSFEPVGTTDMVDLFTGDFNYNIPMFELPGPNGGYPFNLSYHSGVGMDQEASWVGLGWNLNPGAVTRDMRGLPDDFNGQTVTRRVDRKNMITYGVGYGYNAELFGAASDKITGTMPTMFKLYYNNYRGIGYSLSAGFNMFHKSPDGNRVGFDLRIDSQEGPGMSADIGLGSNAHMTAYSFGVGGNFSCRAGLSMSLSMQIGKINQIKPTSFRGTSSYSFARASYTPVTPLATLNTDLGLLFKGGVDATGFFANQQLSGFYSVERLKKKNTTLQAHAYGYNYLGKDENATGSPDELYMNDVNREKDGTLSKNSPNLAIPNLAYDYYNVEGQGIGGSFRPHRSEVGRTFDHDVHSWGAGVSVGVEFPAHGLNIELNYNSSHTKPWNEDNDWSSFYAFKDPSAWTNTYADGSVVPEPLYFKSLGEMTSFPASEMHYIGYEEPVKAVFDRSGPITARKYNPISATLESAHSGIFNPTEHSRNARSRIARNTAIYPITNAELCDNGIPVLKEYDVDFYTSVVSTGNYPIAPIQPVNRSTRNSGVSISSHVGGITGFNPDGNRYVYGLPVYNLSHHEIAYSVPVTSANELDPLTGSPKCASYTSSVYNTEPDYKHNAPGTEEFFSETNLGPYVHSYLLTSILGTDYVDVTGDGVSDDDYGYWVKFNYVKVYGDDGNSEINDIYKWRAPYLNAAYDAGFLSTSKDDKSHIEYGEREMYYLATVETKTHIALFTISSREDGLDAQNKYASAKGAHPYYKLDQIRVFAKDEYVKFLASDPSAKPIKTINFTYNYDLCGAVQNNTNNAVTGNDNHGKLTLVKVSFEYQNNSRGALSPYIFDYDATSSTSNPDYNPYVYDRWGNYRSDLSSCERLTAPYVKQFEQDETTLETALQKQNFKTIKDQEAAVWNLRSITLPTGGKISVTYESDDYDYVQYRKADQMFQVQHFYDDTHREDLYTSDSNSTPSDWDKNDKTMRRVFFKLETPVLVSAVDPNKFFKDYIEGLRQADGSYQLYYKMLMKIRKASEDPEEFISGYSDLLTGTPGTGESSDQTADYGYSKSVLISGIPYYTEGFVTLDLTTIPGNHNNTDEYHPFAVASWQFLRTNMPDLLHTVGIITEATTKADKIVAARSLLSFLTDFEQLFRGFRDYCFDQNYGRAVSDLKFCFIRLTTPDGVKYGGGCRVKQIKINDNWNAQSGETDSEYGQVYDYTTTDKDGNTISSGVASYEPQIGGEETALRCAKHYVDAIPIFTDNDLFFEYPVNESNYPAPVVGYSKVTVKTITTEQILDATLPAGVRGTGAVVSEFYTAKDFPVISDETQITKKPFDLYIPIPFIGEVKTNNMTASQGYSIILNDMHGKPKAITNYGLDKNGNLLDKPESTVKYSYKVSPTPLAMPDGSTAMKLDNQVKVIYDDTINSATGKLETDIQDAIIGEEYDFFTDQRQNRNISWTAGIDFNVEFFGVPVPFPWPSFSSYTNDVRTVVTNKIIHKSGVLVETQAKDGQSTVTTENKIFDGQTGRPLLVTVTNNYDNPIYKYDIPAYWSYDGMGAAYKNIGFSFSTYVLTADATNDYYTFDMSTNVWDSSLVTLSEDNLYNILTEGDEFVLHYDSDADTKFESTDPKYNCTLVDHRTYCDNSGNLVKSLVFHCPNTLATGKRVRLVLTRSGRRNLLGANSGSIVGLIDPTNNANRATQALSSSSYTNAMVAAEMADFLSSIVSAGHLLYQTYNMDNSTFFSSDGNALFPVLYQLCTSIIVEGCEGGFKVIFNLRTMNGTCSQLDCGCFSLPYQDFPIESFTYTGESTIRINYDGDKTSTFTFNCVNLSITPTLTYTTQVLNASAIQFRDFWDYDDAGSPLVLQAHNLYATGKKGIWRPWHDNYYNDNRYRNTGATTGTELKLDGVFANGNNNDKRYFFYNWTPTVYNPVPLQWVPNNTISKYDQNGNEVENVDILGNFSSARFGYDNTLNTVLAANARYNEIYFESVDDPSAVPLLTGGTGTNALSPAIAHTGKNSLHVHNGQGNKTLSLTNYKFTEQKKYVVSMWVARTGNPQLTYADSPDANSAGATVSFTDLNGNTIGSTTSVFKPTGEVIDGWQKIEGEFTTPNNTVSGETQVKLKINLQGGVSGATQLESYYDDIRIFPFDGNMVSYVYDPITFRLSAKLDDNNFATFYYYDEEGSLFLVKQETQKGIATIQEARSHKQH